MIDEADAAYVFTRAALVLERAVDANIIERPGNAIPRSVLNCGEVLYFMPLLLAILHDKFPNLSDPDHLSELLMSKFTESASGRPN